MGPLPWATVANHNANQVLLGFAFVSMAFASALLYYEHKSRVSMYDTLNQQLDLVTNGQSIHSSTLNEVRTALEDLKKERDAMFDELHVFRKAFRMDLDIVKQAIDSEGGMRKDGEKRMLLVLKKLQDRPTPTTIQAS